MAKVIVTVFFVILVSLFCVLAATWLVWGILIIAKEVIELWREVHGNERIPPTNSGRYGGCGSPAGHF